MNPITFLILTGITLLLFYVASKQEKDYRNILFYSAYIFLLITGLTLAITPLTIKSGVIENNTDPNETIISYTYDNLDETLNYLISISFIIISLAGIILYTINLYNKKRTRDYEDDDYE